ncbi:hypothetical protein C4553_02450 [Candidatus Parcubacteria bacterium]|nr:MAG: hypothetical protein C4553_02450 [Candidatus Parcubacteria bacterium]
MSVFQPGMGPTPEQMGFNQESTKTPETKETSGEKFEQALLETLKNSAIGARLEKEEGKEVKAKTNPDQVQLLNLQELGKEKAGEIEAKEKLKRDLDSITSASGVEAIFDFDKSGKLNEISFGLVIKKAEGKKPAEILKLDDEERAKEAIEAAKALSSEKEEGKFMNRILDKKIEALNGEYTELVNQLDALFKSQKVGEELPAPIRSALKQEKSRQRMLEAQIESLQQTKKMFEKKEGSDQKQ